MNEHDEVKRLVEELRALAKHGCGPRCQIEGEISVANEAADFIARLPPMRLETLSEHLARDMREGRFPEQSERQMVLKSTPAKRDEP